MSSEKDESRLVKCIIYGNNQLVFKGSMPTKEFSILSLLLLKSDMIEYSLYKRRGTRSTVRMTLRKRHDIKLILKEIMATVVSLSKSDTDLGGDSSDPTTHTKGI